MSLTPQDLRRKGIEHLQNKEFDKAIQFFSQGIEHTDLKTEFRYDRAKAYTKEGSLNLALEDFNKLIHDDPGNAHFYGERAIVYLLLKDQEKSINDLDKAVELQPQKAYRYASRAFIKDRFGDLAGALADYEKAIELDPEDAISYNNKGLVEERLGYISKAKQSFSTADSMDAGVGKITPTDTSNIVPRKNDATNETEDQPDISAREYIRQLTAIFKSKEERASFGRFLKRFFTGNE